MTSEEREIVRDTVRLAVNDAMTPITERLAQHDTAIALTQQELRAGRDAQVRQGERLGDVEGEIHRLRADRAWVRVLGGALWAVIMTLIIWFLNR